MCINPKYPVYIISKGRADSRLTSKALERMNVPYRIVIEPQEYDQYAAVIDPEKILVLPFSNLGQGSIPARNWVWEHSISEGHDRHWIIDDNISDFLRLNKRTRIKCLDGTIFRITEDFVDRFTNVPMSGFNYSFFANPNHRLTPYILNTRVYSCILLSNDLDFRWRGRYNEDTDLSLRFLKAGYCTFLFNTFLCDKAGTLTMKGGNTEEVYEMNSENFDNRKKFALSLKEQHPDVVVITKKWRRWHHHVDYSSFQNQHPILKEGLSFSKESDEKGLVLVRIKNESA